MPVYVHRSLPICGRQHTRTVYEHDNLSSGSQSSGFLREDVIQPNCEDGFYYPHLDPQTSVHPTTYGERFKSSSKKRSMIEPKPAFEIKQIEPNDVSESTAVQKSSPKASKSTSNPLNQDKREPATEDNPESKDKDELEAKTEDSTDYGTDDEPKKRSGKT